MQMFFGICQTLQGVWTRKGIANFLRFFLPILTASRNREIPLPRFPWERWTALRQSSLRFVFAFASVIKRRRRCGSSPSRDP